MRKINIKLLNILGAVLICMAIGSCGSLRKAQPSPSLNGGEDGQAARMEGGMQPVKDQADAEAQRSKDPAVLLALRLDSLLLTADTLLQQTQLGLHIIDLTTGRELFARHPNHRMRPASSEKVVTAIAALDLLGPSYTLDTRLLTSAAVSGHTLKGDIYIKGVMDPLLSVTDVRALAAQVKAAGITRIDGRLVADASFKDADEFGWGWCWDDDNPTLSPLLVGGKPGLTAALRTAFSRAGISLQRGVTTGTTPSSARTLAIIQRPLTEVLKPMLKESDNLCAEAVYYHVAAAPTSELIPTVGKHYSNRRAVAAIHAVMNRAEAPTTSTIADGSGLSLYNYQTPSVFTHLLSYAALRPDSIFNPLLAALPIAAIDGTLKKRMLDTPAAANVRAKTGSVSAVSTLVGYTTQRSTGHLIAFAIMNNGLPRMTEGRALQDQICVLLSE